MRRFFSSAVLAAGFLLWAVSAVAADETVRKFGVAEAVAEALVSNLSLKKREAEIKTKARAAASKNAWLIPELSTESKGSLGLGEGSDVYGSTAFGLSASLGFSLSAAAGDAADVLAYEAELLSLEAERRLVVRSVARLCYQVLLSERRLATYRRFLASAETRQAQERELLSTGLGSETAALEAESAVLERRIAIEAEKPTLDSLARALRDEIGLPEGTTVQPEGELSADAALNLVVVKAGPEPRPDVEAQAVRERLAQKNAQKVNLEQRGPRVAARVDWFPIGTRVESAYPSGSLSLSLPLDSWIPGSAGADATADSADAVRTAALSTETALRDARREAEDALDAFKAAKTNLGVRQAGFGLSERRYLIQKQLYDSGIISASSLSDYGDDYLSAELNLTSAISGVFVALAELEYAQGSASSFIPATTE